MGTKQGETPACHMTRDVSIILPIHNADKWLDDCLQSVCAQDFTGTLELSAYLDSPTDGSVTILQQWLPRLTEAGISCVVGKGEVGVAPRGVGYAKNRAVDQSSSRFLCFLDADDVMHKDRVRKQYAAATGEREGNTILGCRFHREPELSTERYTKWANGLTPAQLHTQAYTSHGPTVIMPTWFCSRHVFAAAGPFSEAGKGTPEDLIFFLRHLANDGAIYRVDDVLLMYRYHPEATTFSVGEDAIWTLRLEAFQREILAKWDTFSIWNAGKKGRQFFRSLSPSNQKKVLAFCDVDTKKLVKGQYTYEESDERPKPKIPIVHFTQVQVPFVICVKQDLTKGQFEDNLASLNLKEGIDYFFFS